MSDETSGLVVPLFDFVHTFSRFAFFRLYPPHLSALMVVRRACGRQASDEVSGMLSPRYDLSKFSRWVFIFGWTLASYVFVYIDIGSQTCLWSPGT